ncbi:hypothetical protein [Microbulbifer halophilus]|uniref:hypothetical protein n=1 Tax=Microbulbifer halophilus TaxID=453963 RepID=UPI0036172CEF
MSSSRQAKSNNRDLRYARGQSIALSPGPTGVRHPWRTAFGQPKLPKSVPDGFVPEGEG